MLPRSRFGLDNTSPDIFSRDVVSPDVQMADMTPPIPRPPDNGDQTREMEVRSESDMMFEGPPGRTPQASDYDHDEWRPSHREQTLTNGRFNSLSPLHSLQSYSCTPSYSSSREEEEAQRGRARRRRWSRSQSPSPSPYRCPSPLPFYRAVEGLDWTEPPTHNRYWRYWRGERPEDRYHRYRILSPFGSPRLRDPQRHPAPWDDRDDSLRINPPSPDVEERGQGEEALGHGRGRSRSPRPNASPDYRDRMRG